MPDPRHLALAALFVTTAAAAEPPPRLLGIVIAGDERLALFAGEPTLLVHEGDVIGSDRVTAIGARSVELQGPAGLRSVRPGADPTARTERGTTPRAPIVDPYWRERKTENDQ